MNVKLHTNYCGVPMNDYYNKNDHEIQENKVQTRGTTTILSSNYITLMCCTRDFLVISIYNSMLKG